MITEIGGFFELEFNKRHSAFHKAIALNTGRNAFEYILLVQNYKKIYIPFYSCDVLLEPLKKNNIEYEFYYINEELEPKYNFVLKENEALLFINYFGIKDNAAQKFSQDYKNIIIDNTQAFFSVPPQNVDVFYSARKFFGVTDGAYLYTNDLLPRKFEKDFSADRVSHLINRIEIGSAKSYKDFLNNEWLLRNQEIKYMSDFTQTVLQNIDYDNAKQKRIENFQYLHQFLKHNNELTHLIEKNNITAAMVYPYLTKNKNLRKFLISQNIFVATYWKSVMQNVEIDDFESYLSQYLIPLPIDQRYGEKEMQFILEKIISYDGSSY